MISDKDRKDAAEKLKELLAMLAEQDIMMLKKLIKLEARVTELEKLLGGTNTTRH